MASSSLRKDHPWFEICHARPTAKYQVFIFPAAGSPGPFYREWDKNFPECEFSIIIYPGRTTRMSEKLITNLKEYIDQLDKGLLPYINKPCFFIGHSLGTLISFALAKHMIDTNNKGNLLQLMIQMGRGPTHIPDPDKSFADMTNSEIAEDLKRMADPSTKAIFDIPEYVQMLLPMLRADGQVGKEVLPETQLNIPIIAYGGEKEENVKEPMLNRWKELTTATDLFCVRMFPGHHNFPSECGAQILSAIKEDFSNLTSISKIN